MQLLPSDLTPELEELIFSAVGLLVYGAVMGLLSLWCEWDKETSEHF